MTVLELSMPYGVQAVQRALDTYAARLERSIARTRRQLSLYEQQYGVSTAHFLSNMAAEDLAAGDWEYVAWAGEAKILAGLESELAELRHASAQLR